MPLEAPFWWYRRRGVLASALAPLGALYGNAALARRLRIEPYRSRLPVVCIGNFTAGGGGKTPTAIAVAKLLASLGMHPHFLTRGYGGTAQGPVLVREGQSAAEVGDEPLLLAQVAPTTVSADRGAGAITIEASNADVIVMDDGFQNPSLAKDFSLVAVDAAAGIGNGLVIPAGPLREPLAEQIARADALLVVGEGGKAARIAEAFERANKPVLKAKMAANCDPRWLGVLPVIGFAGIARPSKFFATLSNNGARLIDARAYRDHYRYSPRQARSLLREAKDYKAMLVTTEKDWVRLPEDDDEALAELKHSSRPFPIAVKFEDDAQLKKLLLAAVGRAKS
jgi:tetraacyldisaccharide 4'-kinase